MNDWDNEIMDTADDEIADLNGVINKLENRVLTAESALATLKEMHRWIPVSERLPNPYREPCLYVTKHHGMEYGFFDGEFFQPTPSPERYYSFRPHDIVCWKPVALPSAPEVQP